MTFRITQNGKELDKDKYTWDGKTKTLSTTESDLVLDFSKEYAVTFKTGSSCTFKTGSSCTFNTGSSCKFNTGSSCTFNTDFGCKFNTGSSCTFNTDFGCKFNTGSSCTFNTDSGCKFNTGSSCTFNTGLGCTFDTGLDCTFNTGSSCTFKTSLDCTFNTGSSCTFKTSLDCTFNTGSSCTFNTDSGCKFKTGSSCTFNTGSSCTFDTGLDCTFNTDFGCTFKADDNCVVVRRDIFEVIKLLKNKTVQLSPFKISGYVKDGYYYKNNKKQYPAIIADGILSEVINHKGNVYRVKNYGSNKVTYLIKDGDIYSHGDTLKEAKDSIIYKISNRDTSMYKDYTLETEITLEQAIKMYSVVTGACEGGTRHFVETHKLPKKMTVKELIKLTKGQYGNDRLVEFVRGENGK